MLAYLWPNNMQVLLLADASEIIKMTQDKIKAA